MDITPLLQNTIQSKASDLHIVAGYRPTIRVNGELYTLQNTPILSPSDTESMLLSIVTPEQKDTLLAEKELDFGYNFEVNRFRVNFYYSQGSLCGSFRLITIKISPLESLNLPSSFARFSDLKQGFILVTGPTGEGKTTTIAALVNDINLKYAKHIVTIEDPIEYIYPQAKSIISQREIARDTKSWNVALRAALREDPDVVIVGEMRDYETIQTALTIAETGHLVFSTLHTNSAPQTIDRIVDVFPSHQQNQVRLQLSSVLRAIISQRLVPTIDGTGRIPACEVMMNNSALASVIREGKTHLIDNIIETSSQEEMILMERYLFMLYKSGKISKDAALYHAIRPTQMEKMIE